MTAPLSAATAMRSCAPIVAWADVVVGMGGYVSVPVALASLRARRPLVLHEQNAVPGLANRDVRAARAQGRARVRRGRVAGSRGARERS